MTFGCEYGYGHIRLCLSISQLCHPPPAATLFSLSLSQLPSSSTAHPSLPFANRAITGNNPAVAGFHSAVTV